MPVPQPPFQIHTVGHVVNNPRHVTPGTRQGDCMLYAVIGGQGLHRWEGGAIALHAGMIGLVPPDKPGFTLADPDDPYDHWFCRFNGSYAPDLARSIIADRGQRFFVDSTTPLIANLCAQMRPGQRPVLPTVMGRSEILLAEALILLQSREADHRPRGLQAFEVIDYLQDRLDEPFDLAVMAADFAMTKQGLGRAVRRCCGTTPLALLERLRLDLASQLLASGMLTVTEVALRIGYDDPSYFARVFRKHLGINPKRWQARRSTEERGAPVI